MTIENKLIVGRYINFAVPGNIRSSNPPRFIALTPPTLTIMESTRPQRVSCLMRGPRFCNVVAGENLIKTHRNFKWLPWDEGNISETQLDRDVLSGSFSGCFLVVYRPPHEPIQVAHIGTSSQPILNSNVKQHWINFVNDNPNMNIIGCYNPFEHFTIANLHLRADKNRDAFPVLVVGLITQTPIKCYAIDLCRRGASNDFRIAVKREVLPKRPPLW